MKPIAKKDFFYKKIFYGVGDEVVIDTKEELIRLSEKGFIQPLKFKDIQNFGKEEPKKVFKKEEE